MQVLQWLLVGCKFRWMILLCCTVLYSDSPFCIAFCYFVSPFAVEVLKSVCITVNYTHYKM